HHEGDVAGDALSSRNVLAQEPSWFAREKIQHRLYPSAESYGSAQSRPHPGFHGRPVLGKRMARKVLDNPCIPRLSQHLELRGHCRFICGRFRPRSRTGVQSNAIALLADLHYSHQVVWQHLLYDLRYPVEYLADIENIGEGVEKPVEYFKA